MASHMDGHFTHLLPLSPRDRGGGVHFAGGRDRLAPPLDPPTDRLSRVLSFRPAEKKHWIISRNFTPWMLRSGVPCQATAAARGMLRRPLCRRIHFLAESSIWREGGRRTERKTNSDKQKISAVGQNGAQVLVFSTYYIQ